MTIAALMRRKAAMASPSTIELFELARALRLSGFKRFAAAMFDLDSPCAASAPGVEVRGRMLVPFAGEAGRMPVRDVRGGPFSPVPAAVPRGGERIGTLVGVLRPILLGVTRCMPNEGVARGGIPSDFTK